MMIKKNRWSLIVGLILVVIASVVAWFLSPKGDNQTYVLLPVLFFNNTTICPAIQTQTKRQKANAVKNLQTLAKHPHSLICVVLSDVGYVLFSSFFLFLDVLECGVLYCVEFLADAYPAAIAIVFLAQWHPLIVPKRSDIRPGRVPQ